MNLFKVVCNHIHYTVVHRLVVLIFPFAVSVSSNSTSADGVGTKHPVKDQALTDVLFVKK